jgi:putative hydrolase of the HAD superfamily
LHLAKPVASALRVLRNEGWAIGILTNGPPEIQRRKIQALELGPFIDVVVFAAEHGSGRGKPEYAPFAEVFGRLDVLPSRAIVVGDDEACDVAGARAMGSFAVRCVSWRAGEAATDAHAVLRRFSTLPALAREFFHRRFDPCAA